MDTFIRILEAAATPLAIAIATIAIQNAISKRNIARDYVQVATDILREPTETGQDLRPWAVQLIQEFSPIELDSEISGKLRTGTVRFPQASPPETPLQGFAIPKQHQKHILEKLNELVDEDSPCSMCGGTRMLLDRTYTFLKTYGFGHPSKQNTIRPCVSLTCAACGNVQLFTIGALDIDHLFEKAQRGEV